MMGEGNNKTHLEKAKLALEIFQEQLQKGESEEAMWLLRVAQAQALTSIAESLDRIVRDGVGIKVDDEVNINIANPDELR